METAAPENILNYVYQKEENRKERLDLFLAEATGHKRSNIQNLIRRNHVLVNNEAVKCGFLLRYKDEIEVQLPAPINHRLEPEDLPLEIIYQDQDLAVINKPAGMVVHPALGHSNKTLVNALLFHIKELSDISQDNRLGIVHRLDKDTEGLMVVAKNNETHFSLTTQFKNRKVTKKYFALVHGVVKEDYFEIKTPIGRDPTDRKKFKVLTENKNLKTRDALTLVKVVERFQHKTLLEVEIKTGRTHQIRVHLLSRGFPIVGDTDYTFKKIQEQVVGQRLQAYYLSFEHPRTNEKLEFYLPLSERIKESI